MAWVGTVPKRVWAGACRETGPRAAERATLLRRTNQMPPMGTLRSLRFRTPARSSSMFEGSSNAFSPWGVPQGQVVLANRNSVRGGSAVEIATRTVR
jgi:hypothetical protein